MRGNVDSAGCIGCLTEIIVSVKRNHAISNSSGEFDQNSKPQGVRECRDKSAWLCGKWLKSFTLLGCSSTVRALVLSTTISFIDYKNNNVS